MVETKGILLAGGRGTRLYPMTSIVSKQLQPIYNKPMVYYPLTTLIVAGIREVLIISTPEDIPRFRQLLGDGSAWGMRLEYAVQSEPKGIAEALVIAEPFVGDARSMLMLGDNLIYGRLDFLRAAMANTDESATVFAYQVSNPSEYGVVEFDADFSVLSIEEKPKQPRSNWAVPGIYLYPPDAAARARALKPSPRGELEITDLNRAYLSEGRLRAQPLGRGIAWLDTGTPENLLSASSFVAAIEQRQGLLVGSPEEAAYRAGFLSTEGFRRAVESLPSSNYRSILERVVHEEEG
ncbi:MAG: glucose-1-phosphate thymidylyltransferase RfbA [Deltaproteobacteria bacterium]|nr:glucose-1-phosphate thymidylyltransferase RfbA [Deltaproteobacteria bacterium]